MHLDLQLFENNIQQQKPSGLADKKGAHRRIQTAHRLQQTPVSASPSPLLSSLAPPLLPAMLHNQLRCIALSKEASSSKHRQSPVSCASMDQSPLGNPNCNLLTHKGWKLCGQASFSTKRQTLLTKTRNTHRHPLQVSLVFGHCFQQTIEMQTLGKAGTCLQKCKRAIWCPSCDVTSVSHHACMTSYRYFNAGV